MKPFLYRWNRRKPITKILIHCSATRPKRAATEARKDIHRLHQEEKNFDGIGYHVFIQRDGTVQYGRNFDHIGSHAIRHNDGSIGICLAGGVADNGDPEANYTDAQWQSLDHQVLPALMLLFPEAEIGGHCDLPKVSKACPCFDVRRRYCRRKMIRCTQWR